MQNKIVNIVTELRRKTRVLSRARQAAIALQVEQLLEESRQLRAGVEIYMAERPVEKRRSMPRWDLNMPSRCTSIEAQAYRS